MASNCLGFTFIEILISLVLLSLLFLMVDTLQAITLRKSYSAYYFSVATQQLHNMAQQLPADHIDAQTNIWNMQNASVLPQGRGYVRQNHAHYLIDIFWGKDSQESCEKNKLGLSGCLRKTVIIPA
ncbi:MAG TPA: prepilin-type N-terminal cleavage/methylation domain-containing protein [Gammaproteobacteria bacterium]|jgi:prepilin-type N-terminal cleavage/methylation domain-containing protein|nr:prepilin-type N-terminal cleavage/methylation domain-containing protein [Gammaproteobacteria bacterium]